MAMPKSPLLVHVEVPAGGQARVPTQAMVIEAGDLQERARAVRRRDSRWPAGWRNVCQPGGRGHAGGVQRPVGFLFESLSTCDRLSCLEGCRGPYVSGCLLRVGWGRA